MSKNTDIARKTVKNYGDESISGVKTFTSSPIVPTPTTDYQCATKKYVDDNKTAVISASQTAQGIIEIATDAEVQTGTDTTRAVTPAGLLSAFVNSKVANGYTKLPNGVIIQWGSGATGARTLPVTFPNGGLKGFATQASNYGSASNVCVTGLTTTTLS